MVYISYITKGDNKMKFNLEALGLVRNKEAVAELEKQLSSCANLTEIRNTAYQKYMSEECAGIGYNAEASRAQYVIYLTADRLLSERFNEAQKKGAELIQAAGL